MMLFSILAVDAIAVPMSPTFPVAELQYILDHSEATTLLSTERYEDKALELAQTARNPRLVVDIRPKFMQQTPHCQSVTLDSYPSPKGGLMLYTSGTTNRPVSISFYC